MASSTAHQHTEMEQVIEQLRLLTRQNELLGQEMARLREQQAHTANVAAAAALQAEVV
jgi:prefoldin subunit 5